MSDMQTWRFLILCLEQHAFMKFMEERRQPTSHTKDRQSSAAGYFLITVKDIPAKDRFTLLKPISWKSEAFTHAAY
jgi:hypothetical protein